MDIFKVFWNKKLAIVVFIGFKRKGCERSYTYAVAVFQNVEIIIFYAVSDNVCNTCLASGGSAHPDDIVVAPLYVDAVVAHKFVHYDIGSRAAVENIAYNVKMVDCKPLDKLCKSNYKRIGTVGFYNCFYYLVVIFMFVIA